MDLNKFIKEEVKKLVNLNEEQSFTDYDEENEKQQNQFAKERAQEIRNNKLRDGDDYEGDDEPEYYVDGEDAAIDRQIDYIRDERGQKEFEEGLDNTNCSCKEKNKGIREYIQEEVLKLHKITLLESKKLQIEKELKLLK